MLERDDIGALSIGAALLSGGGGGHTRIASLASQGSVSWPIAVHEVQEVDPELPCVAVGVGGSTMVFRERLPSGDLFQEAIEAVDRWTGTPAAAVCLTEIGGMNALTALPHAASMTLIDSDLMGRALPGIDQFTLLVDDLSALVLAVSVGQRGVMVVADARPGDVEHVLRAAFETAGGWAGIALGGFRVGRGTTSRHRARHGDQPAQHGPAGADHRRRRRERRATAAGRHDRGARVHARRARRRTSP